jgi:hypothetical protein
MTRPLPVWLVDWACDTTDTSDEAARVCRKWLDALKREPPVDIARYRELRAQAVDSVPFNERQYTGFWKQVVEP